MKSRNTLQARFIVGLVAVALIVGIVCVLSTSAHGGLFARNCVSQPVCLQDPPAVSPVAAAGMAAAAVPLRERAVMPWNRPDCPNGHCRPHDEVVVNVIPQPRPETPAPVSVSVEPTPPPRFPYGVLLAVLIPVVIVASVVAFIIRVATSRA